jgi:UDP-GlcNAc:undecaprenyl-phosphate GlcNAc-1-phosphate transferase
MVSYVLTCVASGFLTSWAGTWIVRLWAARWGLIDQPTARKVQKVHSTPTPLGGGIGIWAGVVMPVLVAQAMLFWIRQGGRLPSYLPGELTATLNGFQLRTGQCWIILAGGTILSLMGLWDDLRDLPWQPRLLVQFLVANSMVWIGGVRATVFVAAPWFGEIVAVTWIMILINAFNFLDNIDGLSAGIALIASCLFAIVMLTGTSEPRWLVGGFMLVLAGSLGGFLCHNRPPAKIFMGDTGSYFVGLLLSCMTLSGTFYEHNYSKSHHVMFAPVCIMAVPLYDFCSVLIIRLRQGRSPFRADKSHFSHRLIELGFSKPAAMLTICLTTLTTGLGGLLLYQVRGWVGAFMVLAIAACALALIAILETVGRRKRDVSR